MINFITKGGQHAQLLRLLEKEKSFSKDQFKQALATAEREKRHIAEVLFDHTTERQRVLKVVARFYNRPAVELADKVISPYVITLIPKEVAEQHSVVVFKKVKDVIHLATINPEDGQVVDFVAKKTGLKPKVFITTPHDIQQALKKYPSELKEEFANIIDRSTKEALAISDSAEKMAQYVPIIRMVDSIIEQALKKESSDIHVEPRSDRVVIRFRIDGLLHRIVELPPSLLAPLVARLKILSHLKIDEHRLPQDGRFQYHYSNQDIAIRVSAMPSLHGTKLVLRLLSMKERLFTLRKLGLNQRDHATLRQEVSKPQGLLLVTGPTGSGKTTTLYTLLRQLNKEAINIATVEDPIEYGIEGITQTQINPTIGLTFARGLRSLLRQDPNVLMVGEIRDPETAAMAVNAAMTGHLVLTTLHTNNAALAIQRLVEMGVAPYLAATVTNVIIGQRLVRTICEHCLTRRSSSPKVLAQYGPLFKLPEAVKRLKGAGLLPANFRLDQTSFYHGQGCAKCSQTGYRGRVGVYEVVPITDHLAQTILKDPTEAAIQKQAHAAGIFSMIDDALLKVLLGMTTFEELARVLTQ